MINKTKAKEMLIKLGGGWCDRYECCIHGLGEGFEEEFEKIIDQIYNSIADDIDCEEEKMKNEWKDIQGNYYHEIQGVNQVKKQNKDFKERLLK